jgi:hypothetical protein
MATALLLLCAAGGLGLTEAAGMTNLRATVIRIFTPDGTLIVETDDPGVKVTIEGDGGLVITGAGAQEVRLRPGSYRRPDPGSNTPGLRRDPPFRRAHGGRAERGHFLRRWPHPLRQ